MRMLAAGDPKAYRGEADQQRDGDRGLGGGRQFREPVRHDGADRRHPPPRRRRRRPARSAPAAPLLGQHREGERTRRANRRAGEIDHGHEAVGEDGTNPEQRIRATRGRPATAAAK